MGTDSIDVSEVKREFAEFNPRLVRSLVKHIERFVIGLQSYIRANYLSGSPLHQRSGNLKRNLNYKAVQVTPHEVSTTLGDNMDYAPVHELGLTVNVPEHERTMRMVFGKPITPKEVLVKAHQATYPKRAFLVPGLNDKEPDFQNEMDAATEEATEG